MSLAILKNHKNIFKAGLIVADIKEAMADLVRWIEPGWTPIRQVELTLQTPLGRESTTLSFVCSTRGETVLELIQANPSGYYQLHAGQALHHVGMWADDLAATSAQLSKQGMPLEAAGIDGGRTPALFAFHNNPYGLRIELVDSVMRPSFLQWLAGGDLGL